MYLRLTNPSQTNEKMEVLDKSGKPVQGVYCIGDANGKYMLAHAASAQVRERRGRPKLLW